MQGTPQSKRSNGHSDAWILGSGISALASAFYLIKQANIRPRNVHILDQHSSLEEAAHQRGDSSRGYDQFAACLPVPLGSPMKELLSAIPSTKVQGRSMLDEIRTMEANRLTAKGSDRTHFFVCERGSMRRIPVESLNLGYRYRASLLRFLFKRESTLAKSQIRDIFPSGFFHSDFWAVWSAQ